MAHATSETRGARLSRRGLVTVVGPDTQKLLQGLLTSDLGRLDRHPAIPATLLTPQGKILVEMLVVGIDGGVALDVPAGEVATLLKRLALYKLRAKVEISDVSNERALLWLPEAADGARGTFPDPRHRDLGPRLLAPIIEAVGSADRDYDARRIALGIAEQGADYAATEVFPHEANLDQLGGVDFDKGCYVGQEVVSRMHHRGTARSRFVPVTGQAELAERGTPVMAGGREIGRMGSHQGMSGLALLRLDRLAEAVAAGVQPEISGVPLAVRRPAWARFDVAGAVNGGDA
ncbi:MAG: folate-binding protein [Hyphomicrobiaceae bacterium]